MLMGFQHCLLLHYNSDNGLPILNRQLQEQGIAFPRKNHSYLSHCIIDNFTQIVKNLSRSPGLKKLKNKTTAR